MIMGITWHRVDIARGKFKKTHVFFYTTINEFKSLAFELSLICEKL